MVKRVDLKLPHNTIVNKFIAKTKFYEKASLSSKLKAEFTNKIQRITLTHQLIEKTTNISKTDKVEAILIFEIELKQQIIPKNILKIIDKEISSPILFVFVYKNNFTYGITLKENNITQNYYLSEWNQDIHFDFTGIDLEKVYQKLIKAFITNEAENSGDFDTIIDTDNKIKRLEKEIETLNSKIRKEQQFNRKVDLNKTLLENQKQLQSIKENIA